MQALQRDVGEVHRRPLARRGHVACFAVHLDVPGAAAVAAGQDFDLAFDRELARVCRPGDDRAEAFHREDAVDRQPEHARGRIAVVDFGHRREERAPQLVEPRVRHAADRENRLPFEETAGDELLDLEAHELDDVGVNEVALRDGHDAGADAEELADREVLAGLRLDRLVRGHDEQRAVDPADAGEHVFHEALVPRHVDEADLVVVGEPAREAEVDGDAAPLLLGEPIGVDAGQRLDQRGLPVIDVAGRADDASFACHRAQLT